MFKAMTLREIQICARQINKRNAQKNRFEAALHGVKLESSGDESVETEELDDDQRAKIDNDMNALMMIKQMEMEEDGRRKG